MASEKQIAANRRNAAKSTGPKTATGKQVVRINALRHGLQAEQVVIPGEDPEEFEALLRGFEQHYQPDGSLEQALVERLAHCAWRLQRAGVIETTIMSREYWGLECKRARAEIERASRSMDSIASAFEDDSDGDDAEDDEQGEDHNLPPENAEALWRDYEKEEIALNKARAVYERSEEELKSLARGVDRIFLRTQQDLERLSLRDNDRAPVTQCHAGHRAHPSHAQSRGGRICNCDRCNRSERRGGLISNRAIRYKTKAEA